MLAAAAPASADLVRPTTPELARVLAEIHYVPVVSVHLGYRASDIGHDLSGFGFLVAAQESPRLLGAVFESSIFSNRAPEDTVLFRCMLGGRRDPDVPSLSDEQLRTAAITDLQAIVHAVGEPIFCRITRWPRAVPQYTRGHLERVAKAEALAGQNRWVLAGSAYHGVAINDCIADGARVAKDVATLVSGV